MNKMKAIIKQFFLNGVGKRFFQSAKSRFKRFTFSQKLLCFSILVIWFQFAHSMWLSSRYISLVKDNISHLKTCNISLRNDIRDLGTFQHSTSNKQKIKE